MGEGTGYRGDSSADVTVMSAIPGRIRLKFDRNPGYQARIQLCAARLLQHNDVTACEEIPAAASLVVLFANSRTLSVTAEYILSVALDTALPRHPSPAPKPERPSPLHVLHEFPGRLRLRIPWLRGGEHVATEIENRLKPGFGAVQVHSHDQRREIVVKYDHRRHEPSSILQKTSAVLRHLVLTPVAPPTISRARDVQTNEHTEFNPLIVPTLAVAFASIAAAPVALTAPIVALSCIPVAIRALQGLRERKAIVDQLDFAALAVLFALGQYFTCSLMTWLIGLGDHIRTRTMRSSRRAISDLMSPADQRAWMEKDGQLITVPVESLEAGDIVMVYPGDTVPVDGEVVRGQALIDQKILTGESVPVTRAAGDPVFALTTVADGQIAIRVAHIGRETRAGQIARLIDDAPLSDTRIQNYASLLGDRLVIPWFILAALTYVVSADLMRMAAILVLDFATGIRVSAPTTILSAMVGASRNGLFIKGGRALEKLVVVDAIVFDKTGTLTVGSPRIAEVYSLCDDHTEDEVLRLAACAEANLKHPAAKAIVDAATERGLDVAAPDDMEYQLGLGVNAKVGSDQIRAGNRRFMHQCEIDTAAAEGLSEELARKARSLVFVAKGQRLIGLLTYSDPARPESADVVKALAERGVKRIVMLTGDSAAAAHAMAKNLGITDIIAEAYPEQKADVVAALRAEGYCVAVIGDGVNDSPAFTRADVGISVAHGADVARETADVILLDSNLWGLPRAIDIARETMGILNQNINIIVVPTVFGLVASVLGFSTPLISTLINNGTTVIAGFNALRPLKARPRAAVQEQRKAKRLSLLPVARALPAPQPPAMADAQGK